MRALLSAALLAVTLAACASPRPAALAPQPQVDVPLTARLFPPQYGQIAYALNKPAFVAVFEVVPGRGASLVYPTAGTGFTPVLESWVPLRYNPQRWVYANHHAAASWRQSARFTGYGYGYGSAAFGPSGDAPRYFFLVASEDPIAVEQFQHGATAVRNYLGVSYDSYRPYDVMEELAYALLPYAADERWITDVIVDWGYDWGYGYGPMAAYSNARWEPVVCADGTVRMARYVAGWGYDNLPCPLRYTGRPPVLPYDPNDPGTPPDSVGDGRGRDSLPNGDGRSRRGAAGAGDVMAPSPEVRARIAQLRDDATRSRFNEELNGALRRNVELRHRADELKGGRPRADVGRTVRTSPSRQADEAYRRAAASRERERRQAGAPSRGSTASEPRSRGGRGTSARPSASSGTTERGASRGSSGGGSASSGSASSGSSSSGSPSRGSSGSGSTGSGSTGSGRSRIPPAAL